MGQALAYFGRDPHSSDSLRGIVFSKITQKFLTKFPSLATSGRHNFVMITNAKNSRPNGPPTERLVSIFYLYNHFKVFSSGLYAMHQRGTYPNVPQGPLSDIV